MLELAILGLLESRAMHGYEIRKCLREDLGQFSNVSFGSLYPALSRLERAGAVRASEDARPAAHVPMTGSLGGERAALRARRSGTALGRRGRKVYTITDEGRRQFADLLDTERGGSDDARSFGLRLAFARYLPPHARLRLLERRRAQLVQRLGEARAAAAAAEGRLDSYARSLMEHTTETTERDISWLDRLIAAEREGRAPGGSSPGLPATPTARMRGAAGRARLGTITTAQEKEVR